MSLHQRSVFIWGRKLLEVDESTPANEHDGLGTRGNYTSAARRPNWRAREIAWVRLPTASLP